jgi:hypothetical protein
MQWMQTLHVWRTIMEHCYWMHRYDRSVNLMYYTASYHVRYDIYSLYTDLNPLILLWIESWMGVWQVKEEVMGHESLQLQASAANIVSSLSCAISCTVLLCCTRLSWAMQAKIYITHLRDTVCCLVFHKFKWWVLHADVALSSHIISYHVSSCVVCLLYMTWTGRCTRVSAC